MKTLSLISTMVLRSCFDNLIFKSFFFKRFSKFFLFPDLGSCIERNSGCALNRANKMHMDCFMNRCALKSHDTFQVDGVRLTLKDEYIPLLRFVYNLSPVWSPWCPNPAGKTMVSGGIFKCIGELHQKQHKLGISTRVRVKLCSLHLYIYFPWNQYLDCLTIYLVMIYMSGVYNKE